MADRPRLFFRSWWKYQTYQNNPNRKSLVKPPPQYIGVQTTMLHDVDWLMLTCEQRGILQGLMLLAAFDAGHVDADPARLSIALNTTTSIEPMDYKEWLVPCSGVCTHTPSERRVNAVETTSERRRDDVSTSKEKRREVKRSEVQLPTAPTARTAGKPPRKQTGYQVCFDHFAKLHEAVLGLPYADSHARDNKALTKPLQVYGQEAVCEMIGYFWAEQREREAGKETWIGKTTPHIPGFVSKIPLILRDYTVESYGKKGLGQRHPGLRSSDTP